MSDADTMRVGAAGMAPEEVPSLDDFFEEPGGNIPPGWYDATILEGYATGKGTQFLTGDEVGKDGQRMLRFCFGVSVGGSQRNLQKTWFYSPGQFDGAHLAHIKSLRQKFAIAKVKSWPGHGKEQNFSISLGQLSQLGRAVGFTLTTHPQTGGMMATPYVGKQLRVRVSTGKKGYDELVGFSAVKAR
jgi:hypothetical protein